MRIPHAALLALLASALPLGGGGVGCSENFGTAPVDVGGSVSVSAEGFVGPSPGNRVVRSLAGTREKLWLGLERGLYHVLPASGQWLPGHPGFTPSNQPSIPFSILAIDVAPGGRVSIHLAQAGDSPFLFGSFDGGETFRELTVPSPVSGQVDVVAALPASAARPVGGFLVAQGAAVYTSETGDEWVRASVPAAAARMVAAAANAQGAVVLGVEETGGSPAVYGSTDGGMSFESTALSGGIDAGVLDVALSADGRLAAATSNRLVGPTTELEPPATVLAATLCFAGSQLAYAVLLDEDPSLQIGTLVEGDVPVRVAAPGSVAALLVQDGEVFVATNPDADVWVWRDLSWQRRPFAGGSLVWTAIAADPRSPGAIYLGDFLGDVFYGDPALDLAHLQRPQVSIPRALLADLGATAGVYSGNFGVQLRASNEPGAPWSDRSQGQASYSLENFFGPVNVQTLATAPDDAAHLWLGSLLNDGPYESVNGGFVWSRVHEGLGTPYSIPGEDGLPAATQVRAFAFPRGETWMGTFRGGVWSLADGSPRVWRQRNVGLPALDGAPVDTCCFAPQELEIDVRDLVSRGGGLLCATGWGVYRDDEADGTWSASSNGLTNGDIFALAVHPDRTQWVVAAGRGTAANPDWLFLSRDGGRNWSRIDSRLRARFAEDVVWSDPASLELTAILSGSGAWRMEIAP